MIIVCVQYNDGTPLGYLITDARIIHIIHSYVCLSTFICMHHEKVHCLNIRIPTMVSNYPLFFFLSATDTYIISSSYTHVHNIFRAVVVDEFQSSRRYSIYYTHDTYIIMRICIFRFVFIPRYMRGVQ